MTERKDRIKKDPPEKLTAVIGVFPVERVTDDAFTTDHTLVTGLTVVTPVRRRVVSGQWSAWRHTAVFTD